MQKTTADRLKEILALKNMKQSELVELTGIGKSAISQYLSGKVTPKQDKIYLMAKALNVDEGWLMGYDVDMKKRPSTSSPSPLTQKEERNIQKKLQAMMDDLDPNSGLAYYNGEEPLSDTDKELLRISLENSLRLAKQMAKQKFTPKKYRKE